MLNKLGYRFDIDDLEQWQLEAYMLIENTLNEQREKEIKSKRK